VTHCTFTDNQANEGGGLATHYLSGSTAAHCLFSGNWGRFTGGGVAVMDNSVITLLNCVFTANEADDVGGGMMNFGGSPTVTNCTFSANWCEYGNGTGFCNWDAGLAAVATLTNCVFWDSEEDYDDIIQLGSPTTIVTYSNVNTAWAGLGNISADPLFEADGVHIQPASPCRNAGDPNGDYGGQVDIDGQARKLQGRVDMGADEVVRRLILGQPAPPEPL
jgi:hypothetical protein